MQWMWDHHIAWDEHVSPLAADRAGFEVQSTDDVRAFAQSHTR